MSANEIVDRELAWFRTHDAPVIASLAPTSGELANRAPGMTSASAFYAAHDGQPPPVLQAFRWMTNSNYLCIDTACSFGGAPGQLVELIHDDASREVMAPSFDAWFAAWVAVLEAGGLKRGDDDEPWYELTGAGKRMLAELVTKQKRPKAPAKRTKKPKASNDPLLGVFKHRMSASEIADAIAAGADVHVRDAEGKTPLHHATSRGTEAPAQALLAAGAVPAASVGDRALPQHLQAEGRAPALVELVAAAAATS